MHFSTLISAAAFTSTALAGYVLKDDYLSKDFYSNFDFFTDVDPTHGFVKYVDQKTASSMGLMNTTAKASWGVDTKNKDAAGRASIRLTSKKSYNKGLVVIDVGHMPFGCGTWPAFWMVGPDWPKQGEIDILEGVHEQEVNAFTLHTGAGCTIGKDTSLFSSVVKTKNCDIKGAGQDENAGCGVTSQDKKSYGAGLNNNGGGVFATEWTSDYIQIFFFPKGSVPKDALGDAPNPSGWGKPAARFDKTGCNIDQFFKNQQIVFDTTFCGDWAGNTWSTSTCKSKAATCNAFVQNNPSAFTNAYWNINALKVYQNGGAAAPTSAVASSKPATSAVASSKPATSASASKLATSAAATKPSSSAAATKPASSAVISSKAAISTGAAIKPPISAGEDTKIGTSAAATAKVSQVAVSSFKASSPAAGSSSKAAVPSSKASGGMGGGFTWPTGSGGKPSGTGKPVSSSKPSVSGKPFQFGNSTVAHPSGSGAIRPSSVVKPSGAVSAKSSSVSGAVKPSSYSAIDWNTVSKFPTSLPASIKPSSVASSVKPTKTIVKTADAGVPTPGPNDDPDEDDEAHIVYETVVKTVVVTVEPPAATGGSHHKRHASLHRRRQGQHMHHA